MIVVVRLGRGCGWHVRACGNCRVEDNWEEVKMSTGKDCLSYCFHSLSLSVSMFLPHQCLSLCAPMCYHSLHMFGYFNEKREKDILCVRPGIVKEKERRERELWWFYTLANECQYSRREPPINTHTHQASVVHHRILLPTALLLLWSSSSSWSCPLTFLLSHVNLLKIILWLCPMF